MLTKIRAVQRHLVDEVIRRNPSLGLDERAEFFAREFEKHIAPQSQVLDIGGGWGFYAAPLEKRGHDVTVLEVVKPAYQRAPVVIYDPAKPFPFPDKSFDTSMLVTVLHHIPDPVSVIREALRVTRGSLIVVEDIYRHALGRFWTVLRDQIYNFEYFGHPKQFRKKEEWLEIFSGLGCALLEEKEVTTQIAGLSILNGVFVLRVP